MVVNGKEVSLEGQTTVAQYLEAHGYKVSRIAVELNEAILPKARYADTILNDSDRLEIVSFVGGG